jgi:hypothetical protein
MQFSKEPYISAAKISISPQTTKDLRGKMRLEQGGKEIPITNDVVVGLDVCFCT